MKCDEEMFAKLYESVFPDLYRYALCILGHPQDAEDAVSEAVTAAYGNIRKLRKREAFKSWIFTILANVCRKRMRTEARERKRQREVKGSAFRLRKWIMRWRWMSEGRLPF